PAEIIGVHGFFGHAIGAEHDAVLIIEEKLASTARLAAEFGLTRAEFDVHIGVLIEPGGNGIKVFRPVGDVEGDEGGMGMLGKDVVLLVEESLFAGEFRAVETPGWIGHQFFIALVVLVGGSEEGLGIGGVNRHGNAEASAFFPNGIHAGVVDGDKLAGTIAHAEAKILQDFQAAGAATNGVIELLDHFLAEIRIVDFAPIHLSENNKAVGI